MRLFSFLLAVGVAGCALPSDDFGKRPVQSLERPPPPIRGGTLGFDRDRDLAVVADPDRDRIHLVAFNPLRVTVTFDLPVGAEPGRVAVGEDRYWVALSGIDAVAELTPDTEGLEIHEACTRPQSVAVQERGVVVACATGEVMTYRADSTDVLAQLEPGIRDVVMRDDRWAVTRFREARLEGVTEPSQLRVPNYSYDDMEYVPAGATRIRAWAGKLYMLHSGQRLGPPRRPARRIGYFEAAPPRDPCDSGAFSAALTVVPGASSTSRLHTIRLVDDGRLRSDFAIDTTGQMAVVSPSQVGGAKAPLELFDVRPNPSRQCLQPWRRVDLPGQATSVESTSHGFLVLLREPAALWLEGEMLALGGESRRDTGHDLFYFSTGRRGSCAHCHLDGGDDSHTWILPSGEQRRTIPLLGGLEGRPVLHWDGRYAEFEELIGDHFSDSSLRLSDGQTAAFRSWVNQLPSAPSVRAPVPEGERIYVDLGCAGCHGTDGVPMVAMADVGTGRAKVPGLAGLAYRAPYMRTGCATTLSDRFDPDCGGHDHGSVDALSAGELEALMNYLRAQ
ncbi:MAG: c-type cytochrome [Myxococcota bacterium]